MSYAVTVRSLNPTPSNPMSNASFKNKPGSLFSNNLLYFFFVLFFTFVYCEVRRTKTIDWCLTINPVLYRYLSLFQIPFFEDVGAMTLQYMDSLFQRDNLEKSQFFKGLPKIIEKTPKVTWKMEIVLAVTYRNHS